MNIVFTFQFPKREKVKIETVQKLLYEIEYYYFNELMTNSTINIIKSKINNINANFKLKIDIISSNNTIRLYGIDDISKAVLDRNCTIKYI